jgi:hypothetical protein
MCLSCNSKFINEKSIMQNFQESGNNLDNLFNEKKYKDILSLYKKDYIKKIKNAIQKYKLENIYYLIFISIGKNIYMSLFKLNIENIINFTYTKLTTGNKSLICINFIDNKYGNTKIYKSKKRLELKFNKSICFDSNSIKIY